MNNENNLIRIFIEMSLFKLKLSNLSERIKMKLTHDMKFTILNLKDLRKPLEHDHDQVGRVFREEFVVQDEYENGIPRGRTIGDEVQSVVCDIGYGHTFAKRGLHEQHHRIRKVARHKHKHDNGEFDARVSKEKRAHPIQTSDLLLVFSLFVSKLVSD